MHRLTCRSESQTAFERPGDMPEALHALLCARGIGSLEDAGRFLNPGLDQLHDPMLLSCMGEAVGLIHAARDAAWVVCVYGDYDVDGVCATAILCSVLGALGLSVRHYIPSRHDEGYGLNEAAIREIAAWAKLLISVDCGVTAVEQVELARGLGLEVLVTDHHQPGESLPDCALVNPLLSDYPFPNLCGAGVAFKLCQALDPELALREIDLAALATVADVVPLAGENRVLVALGLEAIRKNPRPGIEALMNSAGVKIEALRAGNIAFQLAPRLNASGRLGDAQRALQLLTAESLRQAAPIAQELEAENTERRRVELEILSEATQQMRGFDFVKRRVIVLHGDDWNVGVIGLAASRLVERYHLPVVLLSGAGEAISGSCRSIPGVDIYRALTAASHLLTRFGGHTQAAGLTLPRANLPGFREALDDFILSTADPMCFIPQEAYDLEAGLGELTERLVNLIARLEPFGFGNPSPVFLSEARIERAKKVGAEGAHLSLTVSDGDARRGAIGFRMGGLEPRVSGRMRLLYAPKLNTFNGQTDVQLELKAALPLSHQAAITENAQQLPSYAQLFLTERLYNRAYPVEEAAGFDDELLPVRALTESPYGTLVVVTGGAALERFLQTAHLAGADDSFDLLFGHWPEGELPLNAVCVLPQGEPPEGYRRLYSLDAPLALWGRLPDEAYESETVRAEWLDQLPGVDQLRTLYRMVRDLLKRPYYVKSTLGLIKSLAEDELISPVAVAAGLPVLRDMRLIEYTIQPPALSLLPMRKREPDDSQIFQQIVALGAWRR